jgi:GAF domain-containing protein
MLDSLGRAQRNEETLARRNRELQASQEEIEALNAALERRVSERTRDLQVAADVSRQITTIHDRTLLLEQVVERTREAFGLYYVGIFLYNAARREAVFFQGTGQEGRTLKQEHITFREAGSGLIARAMRTRQPILVKDVFVEQDFLPSPQLPETGSELVLPMIVGTKLTGVLDLQDRQTSRFSADDMRVLTALAEQIGIAIENAQLFDEVQAARRESETLYHISEAINNATSNKTIVQAVALELGAVPYNVVLSIFEHHDYSRASFLEAVAIRPVGQAQTNSISIRHPLPPVRPSPGSLLVIENTETQPEHPMAHYFKADGIRAVLSAAVVFGGRIIGLLSFNSPQPYIFSAFERRLVRGVADLAAAAIERSRLLAEAHATREEAEILYRIGESINATTSYLEIVDAIAHYDTGATKSTIALSVFEDFDYKRAAYADIVAIRAAGQTQALAATMRFPVLPLPLVKGEILIIEDVGILTREIADAWEAMNINSVMVCPIALGERIIGTLSFATTVPRTYSQLERRLIRGSADLTAAAIERSHLLNQARTKPAPR